MFGLLKAHPSAGAPKVTDHHAWTGTFSAAPPPRLGASPPSRGSSKPQGPCSLQVSAPEGHHPPAALGLLSLDFARPAAGPTLTRAEPGHPPFEVFPDLLFLFGAYRRVGWAPRLAHLVGRTVVKSGLLSARRWCGGRAPFTWSRGSCNPRRTGPRRAVDIGGETRRSPVSNQRPATTVYATAPPSDPPPCRRWWTPVGTRSR